ncbi:hypothetical protein BV20DRAFT_984026, partial [Pilatotrama ljubarskyi]
MECSEPIVYDVNAQVELYDVPEQILIRWGFLINRRLKCFICLACQAVVLPSSILQHLSRQHSDTRISVDSNLLGRITASEHILHHFPPSPASTPLAFAGLGHEDGFGCPSCSAVYGSPKAVAGHMLAKHSLPISEKDPSIRAVIMQRFSTTPGARTCFEVKLPQLQLESSQATYLEALREDLDIRPSLPSSEVDHRHISPWHITTRWHSYLDGHNVSEALALIAIPKEGDPLFSLVTSVKSYIQGTYDTIPYTSELCRQILNTDVLTEDLNHTPFGQHQMEDTLRAYSRLVLQLLCFLLRSEADL